MNYETFQEWSENAEADDVMNFGYLGRNERSIYYMFDHPVFIETYFPVNFLKPLKCAVKATGFNITKDSEIMKLAEKHGAVWEQGYYAEEGYGWPVWWSEVNDGAEECFNFLVDYKNKKGDSMK